MDDADLRDSLTRVVFEIPQGDDDLGVASETVWAEHHEETSFRLRNSPVYAGGYAYGDIVEAVEKDGLNVVTRVIERSGHSSLRIIALDRDHYDQAEAVAQEFGGVTFGSNLPILFQVHIPRDVRIEPILRWLEAAEKPDPDRFSFETIFVSSAHAREVASVRKDDAPAWLHEYL